MTAINFIQAALDMNEGRWKCYANIASWDDYESEWALDQP